MYDRRPKSNFRGLSLGERAEARDPWVEAGSRNEFWWLSAVNVTSLWQATKILNEIPAALWRLGFASDRRRERLTPSTKLRLRKTRAFFSAQDDRLTVCFAIIVRFLRTAREVCPYRVSYNFALELFFPRKIRFYIDKYLFLGYNKREV